MNRFSPLLMVLSLLGARGSMPLQPNRPSPAPHLRRMGPRSSTARRSTAGSQVPADSWTVKEGAMASTGAGRGVIYTKQDYSRYRLVFTMRHVFGKTGPPGLLSDLLHASDRRKKGPQRPSRHSIPAAQRRPLGLSQGPQQRWKGRVHVPPAPEIRPTPMEPGGDRGQRHERNRADVGRPTRGEQGCRGPRFRRSRSRQGRPHRLANA